MSIKVWLPNDEKVRQELERDRKYWNKIYSRNDPGICPDTKSALDLSDCAGCIFNRQIAGRDVRCALAHGDRWIKHEERDVK